MLWRVAFPLAPFGAIASLSSERNAVNKSSALTMNRFAMCQFRQELRGKVEQLFAITRRSLLFAAQVRLAGLDR